MAIPTGSTPPDLGLMEELSPPEELTEFSTSGILKLETKSSTLEIMLEQSMLSDFFLKATVRRIFIVGLASCSDDKTIKIYDLRSNQLLQHYNAHRGAVNEISFHPSGLYMASCSTDSKVKLWDLRKGKTLYTLLSHNGSVDSVDFSFAGDYFATGGEDKNMLLWKSNFYDSKTRENEMIQPKVKVVNDRVVKFSSKVEAGDKETEEIPSVRTSALFREKLGDEVMTMEPTGAQYGQGANILPPEPVNTVEVQADSRINTNLERIMGQMDKVSTMLREMESRVTSNEGDIMRLCNFVKNDVEKQREDWVRECRKEYLDERTDIREGLGEGLPDSQSYAEQR